MSSSYEWTRDQLDKSGASSVVKETVRKLLEVWEQTTFSSDEERARVREIFSDLVQGHAVEAPEMEGYEWMSSLTAKPRQHDKIRIKRDAYTNYQSRELNGQTGIIARISRGMLVVALDTGGTVHITPDKLETLVPVRTI
jgi:hypothetical protein